MKLPWLGLGGCRPFGWRSSEDLGFADDNMLDPKVSTSRVTSSPFASRCVPCGQGSAVWRGRWAPRRARRCIPVLPGEATWEPCSFAAFLYQSFTHPSPSTTVLQPPLPLPLNALPGLPHACWSSFSRVSQAAFAPSSPELLAADLPYCTTEVQPLKRTCHGVRYSTSV